MPTDNLITSSQPATCVLLATDLSARCDRALDRASQLCQQWDAELLAVNVLELGRAPDMALDWVYGDDQRSLKFAHQQLQQDLAGLSIRTDMQIVHGSPCEEIVKLANAREARLVVTGMAKDELFGRFLAGSTVESLARQVSQPLLVVRKRPHGPYQRILVATDFSESSRYAMQTALAFFPAESLILYHAHQSPMAGAIDERASSSAGNALMQRAFADFLAASGMQADEAARVSCVAENGGLEKVLTQYVRDQAIELVIMGTHGRSGLLDVLLGSTAAKLLDWLPCDTMIVRDPRAKP